MSTGFVWIVGAGPGDPRLLTLKAKECLEQADVVIYDRLITPSILAFARPTAELIYAGKTPNGNSQIHQSAINELLIAKAREGKKVVRLKNGDPFVFGRGAEEAEALANAGVPFEIVPGLSSVFAVPAYAGIPLTDRRYASNFAVGTGHCADGKPLPFKKLAKAETVVALMGVSELPKIVAELIEGGKDPRTPAAIIEWGTTPNQKTVVAPLAQLPEFAQRYQVQPPAVLVVGEVVRLRDKIAWCERKPLFGKRILIATTEGQTESLDRKLGDLGAEVIPLPVAKVAPVNDKETLSAAIELVLQGHYDWVVFTSPQGVRKFFEIAWQFNADARSFASIKFAVIGSSTGKELQRWGIRFDAMLANCTNGELTELLITQSIPSHETISSRVQQPVSRPLRLLLWRGHGTGEALAQLLKQAGVDVDEICAYRIVPNHLPSHYLTALLKEPVHIVIFADAPSVRAFFTVLGEELVARVLQNASTFALDFNTAQTAAQKGLTVSAIPEIDSLAEAIIQRLSKPNCLSKVEGN
mgnify:CR=1 FL=1